MIRSRMVTVSAVLAAATLAACEEEKQVEQEEVVRPVRAAQVSTPDTLYGRWLPGVAKAAQETDIAFEVSGRLTERPVVVGDAVEAGQLLAKLDPRDYENELATSVAERERAASYLDRIQQAVQTGAVAQQDLTDAQARFDQAEAQVRIKEKALSDTEIHSPFVGTVSYTYKENFDNVTAKEPVIRVVDTSRIEFVVNVPENAIRFVPTAQNIRVRFDQFQETEVPAEIKEIATEPTETTRTYPVVLILDPPEGAKVLPGMAGRASADPPESDDAPEMLVPIAAVFTDDEGATSYVWVVDKDAGVVSRREVVTDRLVQDGIVIKSGVETGDWIATAGVNYLEEGQKIRLLEDDGIPAE